MQKRNRFIYLLIAIGILVGILYVTFNNTTDQEIAVIGGDIETDRQAELLSCITRLPLKMKIGQKLMVAGYKDKLQYQTPLLADLFIGGIIVMNEVESEQITHLRNSLTIAPLIAVDQEGGSVQRYKSIGILPAAQDMATYSADKAYELYLKDYTDLKKLGITTNFAPVVDILSASPNPLPGRIFSDSLSEVIRFARENIRAAKQAGITPVIKHFPGLGSATGNTDFESATTDPLSMLKDRDIVPYKELATLQPDIMVGNMIVPDLTDGDPAIWSESAIQLARSLGYQDSVIYSDSLTAQAVPGNLNDAVFKSWLAGVDIALIVQSEVNTANLGRYLIDIIDFSTTAVQQNKIDMVAIDNSVLRIFNRKQIDPCRLAEEHT
jgi:beta-N-acetylhexosaminidase